MSRIDNELVEGADYIEVERIEHNNGYFMWIKGHPYPIKGLPNKEAMEEINKLKKGKRADWSKLLLPDQDLCTFAQAFWQLSKSRNLAYIFQYDEAYRFRLQDLFAETTPQELGTRPVATILRLLAINKQRDYPVVHRKFKIASAALCLFFLWPPNRHKLRRALSGIDFTKLQPDAGDLYWMEMKADYDYGSKYGSYKNQMRAFKK